MTPEQVTAALGELCPGAVTHADPATVPDAAAALALPGADGEAVAARAGDAVLLLGVAAVQRIAAVMMGAAPDAPVPDDPLTGLEATTVGRALASALGTAPELLPEDAPQIASLATAGAPAIVTELTVCGEPVRLVQVFAAPAPASAGARGTVSDALEVSLRAASVRLSAEIGRTRLPTERLVEVPAGAVIELDRDADDPIDLFINGRRFALGRLELTPTGEWAVRIERVLDPDEV